jgi:RsiW-degrading membrane proteinase PrsW (M82 family)
MQIAGATSVAEEMAKAVALLCFSLLFRHEFHSARSGALHGALLGIGFSMAENGIYSLSALSTSGWNTWSLVVFLRIVVFGLWHAFYTALAGAGLGWKPAADGPRRRWPPLLAGIGVATAFHGLHNVCVSLGAAGNPAIMVLSLMSHVGGMVLLSVLIAWGPQREQVREAGADRHLPGREAMYSRPLARTWADTSSMAA